MSSKLSTFICQNCGTETSQYFGKCLNCNSWNSIVEEMKSNRSKHENIKKNKKSIPFNEISSKKISRFTSGFREFDRVLGGGIVPGSVVLLGGEPGIGKSTIVLQSAGKISLNEKVLYVTAEESLEQVKIRWERLNQNSIDLKGSIGYINSLNPDIQLLGNIPYWFDRRGINFGDIDSSFKINRTQLSNLNIFRKNDIRGFVTAKGELKGKISDPDISIKFNVDYPHFKGIRIREIWEGDIKNKNDKFLLNMKNRYSPIPSFLSIEFDYNLKLDNVSFSRIFNSNKGSIEVFKENNSYIWTAKNFPLDELELSIGNNQFDRIEGIINGSGSINSEQPYLDGRLAWSLGKYRNIKLANSLFNFSFNDNSFYINSSLYPIDGGIIEVDYDSNKNNLINLDLNDISTSWTVLTALDIFNFDDKKVIQTMKSNILDDLEINKENNSFKERIDFINNFIENNNEQDDNFNLQKYFNKFISRYNAKVTIEGNRPSNYKLNAKLNGYLDVFRDDNKNKKEEFSINLEGGLLTGKGSLRIKKLPLSASNIFLVES